MLMMKVHCLYVMTNVTVERSDSIVLSHCIVSVSSIVQSAPDNINEPSTSPVAPSETPAQNQPENVKHKSKNIVSKSPGLISDTPYVTRSG